MSSPFKKSAKEVFDKVAKTATEATEKLKTEYVESGMKSKVEAHAAKIDRALEESGVKAKVGQITAAAGDEFDKVSGAKILRLVEERLDLQTKYNDILATKLDEALKRIKVLEDQLAQKKA